MLPGSCGGLSMCWSLVCRSSLLVSLKKVALWCRSGQGGSVASALQVDEMEPILSAFRARLMWFRNLVWWMSVCRVSFQPQHPPTRAQYPYDSLGKGVSLSFASSNWPRFASHIAKRRSKAENDVDAWCILQMILNSMKIEESYAVC